jgi:hypothetical protein
LLLPIRRIEAEVVEQPQQPVQAMRNAQQTGGFPVAAMSANNLQRSLVDFFR